MLDTECIEEYGAGEFPQKECQPNRECPARHGGASSRRVSEGARLPTARDWRRNSIADGLHAQARTRAGFHVAEEQRPGDVPSIRLYESRFGSVASGQRKLLVFPLISHV
jgi:hypothetical protein